MSEPVAPPPGLRAYLHVVRTPGVAVPALGAAVASVPIGMLGLSLLLLVQQRSGSFGAAGAVVAVLGIGTVVGMVVQGRLLDRIGPRRVLAVSSTLRALASVAFVVAAGLRAPLPVLAALAFVIGVGEPQVNGALRAMWPSLVRRELLPAANAVSSVLFEVPVVAGPLLLAVVMVVLPVEVAVLGAAGFAVAGAGLFAHSGAARRWRTTPPPREPGRVGGLLGPLAIPAVRVIVLAVSVPGTALGVLQVTSAAAVDAAGAPARAGLLYALLTVGSLLGTVLYGSRARAVGGRRLLPALLVGEAAALAAAAVAPDVGLLAVVVCAFGVCGGPIAVRCFIDLQRCASHAPAAAVTVVIAAGLAATSLGSAAAGWAADTWGLAPPLLACSGLLLAVAAGLSRTGRGPLGRGDEG
jgi:predicted MFS family arabinose efflux permease